MSRFSSSEKEGKLISEKRVIQTKIESSGLPLGGTFLVADNVNVNDWYFNILGP